MSDLREDQDRGADLVGRLAERCRAEGLDIGVAESLTGGLLSSSLARGPEASRWFRGGLVAYQPGVKYELLGVPAGPVVSEQAARAMAAGAVELFRCRLGLSLTGVGGPEPEDGQEPGTVWAGVQLGDRTWAERCRFAGPPEEVCERSCLMVVRFALDCTDRGKNRTASL